MWDYRRDHRDPVEILPGVAWPSYYDPKSL